MPALAQSRGFTLIELVVAFAIVALLVVLGMPSFTAFVRNSEIRSTAESLINGLRVAKTEAANRNARVVFTLAGASDPSWAIYLVNPDNDADCTDHPGPPIQQYAQAEAGKNTTIAVFPAGRDAVCFNGLGRIVNQGAADHIQSICIFVGACVPGEFRPLQIIVDDTTDPLKPRGIRMCDPDPALAILVPPDPRAC